MKTQLISCGENHTFAVLEVEKTEEGSNKKLFVWGGNDKW
jgi:hypothetical protein